MINLSERSSCLKHNGVGQPFDATLGNLSAKIVIDGSNHNLLSVCTFLGLFQNSLGVGHSANLSAGDENKRDPANRTGRIHGMWHDGD